MSTPSRFLHLLAISVIAAIMVAACSSGANEPSLERAAEQNQAEAGPASAVEEADEAVEQSVDRIDAEPAPFGDGEAAPAEADRLPEAATDPPIQEAAQDIPAADEPDEPGTEEVPIDAGSPALLETLALKFPQHDAFTTFDVWTPDDQPLIAAVSTGLAPFPTSHILVLHEQLETGFAELAVLELEFVDFVFPESVQQILVRDEDRILGSAWGDDLWFTLAGGVGAHGGVFFVVRWDGEALSVALTGGSSTPFAGELSDFDGDGVPEVILDDTNAYVFCYACGVREIGFQIARWDGSALVRVALESLPDDAEEVSREAVDFAIALAEADLWRDAVAAVDLAQRLEPTSEIVKWNAIFIREMARIRLGAAESADGTAYPLLSFIFAGEHNGAARYLDGFEPIDLIDLRGPVTAGTAAEGWEDQVARSIVDYTDRALAVQPELASALFLRGLARYWLAPDQADLAITDITAATALAPDDTLFVGVANLLTP